MKALLLALVISLPTVAMSSTMDELCFTAIQKELSARDQVGNYFTLKDITPVDETEYHAYAWMEDSTNPNAWPFHTYWGAVVEKGLDSCKVLSLSFVTGNM